MDFCKSFNNEYTKNELEQNPIDLPILMHPDVVAATLKAFLKKEYLIAPAQTMDTIHFFPTMWAKFKVQTAKKSFQNVL